MPNTHLISFYNNSKFKAPKVILFFLGLMFFSVVSLAADTTAPTTTSVRNPTDPDGKNDWFVTPVTYTLTATDLESGVKEIDYRINSGSWQRAAFQGSINLAPNPSFETTDASSNINTKYWRKNNPGNAAEFSRDSSNYAPGFASVSIKAASSAQSYHSIDHINTFAVANPYDNMVASVWVKTSNADPVYFKIIAVNQDDEGNITYSQIAQSSSLSGTNAWTQLSKTFIVSSSAAIGVYMEIAMDGRGDVWMDAVNIGKYFTNTSTDLVFGVDGLYTLDYYSVDRAENIEATHTVNFKLDQTPPGNWYDSEAFRGVTGAEHEVYVRTHVIDETSGVSGLSDRYQYRTDSSPTFGYYTDLIHCNTPWVEGWVALTPGTFTPGDHDALLLTQKTDFCNSSWHICKTVRFYAEDLAGNLMTKDYCINGPWVKVRGGGIVRGNAGIDMITEPQEDNTDGLVEVGNNIIEFFTTDKSWYVRDYPSIDDTTYEDFAKQLTGINELGSSLPTTSGVYSHNGDFTINNSTTPSSYKSATFNQVIFIKGSMTIANDVLITDDSSVLFIVKGDVKIDKAVSEVDAAILTDGIIYTAYNVEEGDATPELTMKGLYVGEKIRLQRTLRGTNNVNTPAISFVYEPKYLVKMTDYLGTRSVKWLGENYE